MCRFPESGSSPPFLFGEQKSNYQGEDAPGSMARPGWMAAVGTSMMTLAAPRSRNRRAASQLQASPPARSSSS